MAYAYLFKYIIIGDTGIDFISWYSIYSIFLFLRHLNVNANYINDETRFS